MNKITMAIGAAHANKNFIWISKVSHCDIKGGVSDAS